jgi:deoxyribose-phosphate aldolase
MKIASYIDHTFLKPATLFTDLQKVCLEAIDYGFAAVCIPPSLVKQAKKMVTGSSVKVATVIGFPFGYSATKAKLAEIEQAIADEADELDVVTNLIALKNADWSQLEKEMGSLTSNAHANNKLIKVIIETGLLTDDEIIRCCELYAGLQVDFIKTSTGYAEKGASVASVQLIRKHLPESVRVKASGGIRNYEFAKLLIEAGADRLGCSASVQIVNEARVREKAALGKEYENK